MASGAFERHLRRMRNEYRRRLTALRDAAARHGRGLFTLRPVTTGLLVLGFGSVRPELLDDGMARLASAVRAARRAGRARR